MSTFDRQYQWQRGFLPAVKQILAQHLIIEAPAEEDQRHNTDLIVLKLDTIRVACRIRSYGYLSLFPDDFTIRSSLPSGTPTELAKVIAGWGDYIFYGFAEPEGDELAAWLLGDLNVFRLWHSRRLWMGETPGTEQINGDGSSRFRSYRIDDLPDEFIMTRKTTNLLAFP